MEREREKDNAQKKTHDKETSQLLFMTLCLEELRHINVDVIK